MAGNGDPLPPPVLGVPGFEDDAAWAVPATEEEPPAVPALGLLVPPAPPPPLAAVDVPSALDDAYPAARDPPTPAVAVARPGSPTPDLGRPGVTHAVIQGQAVKLRRHHAACQMHFSPLAHAPRPPRRETFRRRLDTGLLTNSPCRANPCGDDRHAHPHIDRRGTPADTDLVVDHGEMTRS